jgi:PAS domain S-box-containing protein
MKRTLLRSWPLVMLDASMMGLGSLVTIAWLRHWVIASALCVGIGIFLIFMYVLRQARKTLSDQREHQRLEMQAGITQGRLEAVMDNIVDGLITIDENGIVQTYNKACGGIFGYRADEVIGKNIRMLMPRAYADDHDQYLKNYRDTKNKKIIGIGREVEGQRKDGSIFPLDLSVAEVKVGSNRFFSGIVRDITERKQAESALRESEERLSFAVDTIRIGAWEINLLDNTAYRSPGHDLIFGYPQLLPKWTYEMFLEHVVPEDRALVNDKFRHAVETKSDWDFECRINRTDGEKRWIWAKGRHHLDFSGVIPKMSGIVQDITERKNAENELRRSNEELEKFAYVASHDLKAPLRNIDDLAKWVIEDTKGMIPADAEEKLALLSGRVADLETLLDDILSYSRAGRIVENPVEIDVHEMVTRIIQTHVRAPFGAQIKGHLPVLLSSRTPLEQIFGNLLSNAVKHHDLDKGKIEIECLDKGSFCEFIVRDDGSGIQPKYHERAFQMFQTLQSRDKVKGSGLGLSIIKKLVEWQGGQAWIESDGKTRGTAIHFTWPKNMDVKKKTA